MNSSSSSCEILSNDEELIILTSDEEDILKTYADTKNNAASNKLFHITAGNVSQKSVTNMYQEDNSTVELLSSDDDSIEFDVKLTEKRASVLKKLFPYDKNATLKPVSNKVEPGKSISVSEFSKNVEASVSGPSSSVILSKPRDPGVNRIIEGVCVNLPVDPYGCQVALMSMLIKGIKRKQNCLLESPTGSGKTLALLCGALGWLAHDKKVKEEMKAEMYSTAYPELSEVGGPNEYIASPGKDTQGSPDKFFSKNSFGQKSIYDTPNKNNGGIQQKESPQSGQVRIHKRKLDSLDNSGASSVQPSPKRTPEKNPYQPEPDMPNLRVPIIYYGARTHKQLQQVIKEFGRTSYSDTMKMTILSSREYSCIREFDKQMWGTKNDMCKGCVRKIIPKDDTLRSKEETNCKYYDNRQKLKHHCLPPAFDLEDLVKAGHELTACPYYASREMATHADIVFCPYNYLIDPAIRNSMRIDLEDNIVIIDEAHNIEDICRDAATYTFTRENILTALKELEVVSQYRYTAANQEVLNDVDKLIQVLKDWDYWFLNQMKLLENAPTNNNETVYKLRSDYFIETLNNHNIGEIQYPAFKASANKFCNQLQNDPRTLFGCTQATGVLIESIETALGYFFLENGKYKYDFTPVLVESQPGQGYSRNFKKSHAECLSLRLYCMNPAVVFSSLKVAKCVVLASGTLTPLISLHSELDTEFPLKISPSHVIPPDRVWIGTLTSHMDGRPLECKSRDMDQSHSQDSIGQAVLWMCSVTPNGVLCFVPSYLLMNKLVNRWQETGVWRKLNDMKYVFQESRNVKDHNEIMEDFYKYVSTEKGALLFAVYRGKVSEGMDFKDHQARAVITIGVPYPNTFDIAVKSKMEFNDKYFKERNLLSGQQWLKVQAYRALNQAVGRCVRHKGDWGAVLLIDGRFQNSYYTEHLSKWVLKFLEHNHHTFEKLINSADGLESFMQNMSIREDEDISDEFFKS